MSIASDIRSYADNAVTEGRKLLDSTLTNAQSQLNDVSGSANDIVEKAAEAVGDLFANAEKAINVDAIKAVIEPYVAQAKSYQANVADRAEAIYAELRKDPRLARAFEVAEGVSEVVVETARERVVKPVQSLTGLGGNAGTKTTARKPSPTKSTSAGRKPAKPAKAAKKAAKPTKPATTRPAASKTTSGTAKATAARPAAKKATARKTPAKKSTRS